MTDPALNILCEQLASTNGEKLLIADEHLDCKQLLALKALPGLTLLTNRFDIAETANKVNIPCTFNDMDLLACKKKYDLIAYRVSKEKAIVHHIINQAARVLTHTGKLTLSGYKNEGIKTYISKAENYFGTKSLQSKGQHTLKVAHFQAPETTERGLPLDDKDYPQTLAIGSTQNLTLYSKPGQFGWNKLDQGSLLLLDVFAEYLSEQPTKPKTLLDLGCGYGLLSVGAWALGIPDITATDNNAAAIASCRYNFDQHGIQGDVIVDDCAASIHHQYDVILCNPPFHKGFGTEKDLTVKFVRSAGHHLKKKGVAFFVVNQFIPIEKVAVDCFTVVQTIQRNKSFKVVKLSS